MITITCDMCGKKLNKLNDKVDVEVSYSGILPLCGTCFRPQEKQLCITCATRLLNWIENQEKVNDTKEI